MTSAVMSSQSAGSYSRTSRWMIQTQEIKRRRTGRTFSRKIQYIQQLSQDDVPVASYSASSRKHFKINVWTTSRSTMKRKTRCEVVAMGKYFIPVDWIAKERKPDAEKKQLLREVL
ncbi:hypothetical protein F511_31396 [Dorcoceras hygrometricum]|uniref:Uncharacterized protein n=1 Tax=Dorcoceras hygrometricum TaxID=472368 RepID=A0A2Z7BYT7_9LAMI|nr:hypothetical protein F511_31396 [Dorcoceras hygrometricum]